GTSWDYNLVTTFPLLIVLFRRMRRPQAGILPFALLLAGLVGIVGHRGLFDGSPGAIRLHIAIQWGFLMATAAAAPWLGGEADPSLAPEDGAAQA
ncbi:MAG: hypothetical protein NDI82_04795, partial [Anaeromyxobacteraceae bacterium]|nr:hypothetical protein [Anaeromyxobacteraceae bacterium]